MIFGHNDPQLEYHDRECCYAVIINENGQIAAVFTPAGSFLPGGGIEGNETLEECLRRELLS